MWVYTLLKFCSKTAFMDFFSKLFSIKEFWKTVLKISKKKYHMMSSFLNSMSQQTSIESFFLNYVMLVSKLITDCKNWGFSRNYVIVCRSQQRWKRHSTPCICFSQKSFCNKKLKNCFFRDWFELGFQKFEKIRKIFLSGRKGFPQISRFWRKNLFEKQILSRKEFEKVRKELLFSKTNFSRNPIWRYKVINLISAFNKNNSTKKRKIAKLICRSKEFMNSNFKNACTTSFNIAVFNI